MKIAPTEVIQAIEPENVPGGRRQDRRPARADRAGLRDIPSLTKGRLTKVKRIRGDRRPPAATTARSSALKDVARVELASENYESAGYIDGKPAGSIRSTSIPTPTGSTSSTGRRDRWTTSRAFRRGLDYTIVYNTTDYVDENIKEVEHTLVESFHPGHDRRVRVPPGLPRHDHPDAGDPGVAGRDLRGDGGLRLFDQLADARAG